MSQTMANRTGDPVFLRLLDFAKKFHGIDQATFCEKLDGPFLLVDSESEKAHVIDLGRVFQGDQLTIGRSPNCTVTVNEQSVSRHHAGVHFNGKYWTVTDLRSTNGTFMSKRMDAFKPVRLESQLSFRVGDRVSIQFLSTRALFRAMQTIWGNSDFGQKSSRIHTPNPIMRRRSTQRHKLTRKLKAPNFKPEPVVQTPRLMKSFVMNVQELSRDEFLKRFDRPFLLLLSLKASHKNDDDLSTREVSGMAALSKLNQVNFWQLEDGQKKGVVTIGRDDDNDIAIKHPSVSRHHIRLVQMGKGWIIEDIRSTNGVHLDGERLEETAPLGEEALIRLGGDCLLQFLMPTKVADLIDVFKEYPYVDF